jgi:hypothetical protein
MVITSIFLLIFALSAMVMVYLSIWYDPRMADPMCNTDVYFRALTGLGALFGGAVIMSMVYHTEIERYKKAQEQKERAEIKGAIEYGAELRKKKRAKYEPWAE